MEERESEGSAQRQRYPGIEREQKRDWGFHKWTWRILPEELVKPPRVNCLSFSSMEW